MAASTSFPKSMNNLGASMPCLAQFQVMLDTLLIMTCRFATSSISYIYGRLPSAIFDIISRNDGAAIGLQKSVTIEWRIDKLCGGHVLGAADTTLLRGVLMPIGHCFFLRRHKGDNRSNRRGEMAQRGHADMASPAFAETPARHAHLRCWRRDLRDILSTSAPVGITARDGPLYLKRAAY